MLDRKSLSKAAKGIHTEILQAFVYDKELDSYECTSRGLMRGGRKNKDITHFDRFIFCEDA